MANRFWVGGGTGNYNSTTNWSASSGGASGASVPTTADDVFFDASSGSGTATINVASNCASLNLTGFGGSFVFTNNLTVNGTTLNFGSGGYTVSVAGNLRLLTAMTITSNGTTFGGNVDFAGAVTFTLADNMSVSGNVIFSSAVTQTLNGNVLSIVGNLIHSNQSIVTGTTSFVLGGTGTWSHPSTGIIRNNLTINTAGTITLGTNIRYNTGILTYTAGTVVTAGSTLNIAAATTLNTNGVTWNNIITSFNGAITLGSNLTLTGTLTISSTTLSFTLGGNSLISANANLHLANGAFTLPANQTFKSLSNATAGTINGNTLTLTENIALGAAVNGTTNIVYAGTGSWTGAFNITNNLTINTAGTLTLGTNIRYNTGILTYTAGTVVTAGSTLNISANTTLTTDGITWNNITISGIVTITLGSNLTLTGDLSLSITSTVLSITSGGNNLISNNANLYLVNSTFNLPANQTFKTLSVISSGALNNNTFTLTENISLNGSLSGTSNIVYGGTGTWTAVSATHIINNNFTINTAGTLTISGTVYKATNTFTYIAGTIIDTGAEVLVGGASATTCNIAGVTWEKLLINGAITLTSDINAVTFGTFGSLSKSFTLGGNTLNFTHLEFRGTNTTTLPFAWVCQNINFANASTSTLNGFSITINGDILQSGSGISGGTTTFTYGGTGTWSNTGTYFFSNSFTINTSGTLTFSGGSIGNGVFTYTAGTVNVLTGSILYIKATNTNMNHGSIVWYDVILGAALGSGSIASLVLNNKLICSNSLILGVSNTVFSGTDGTFDTYDLYFGSLITSSTTTRLVATKTYIVRRLLSCTQAPSTFPLILNSTVVGTRAIFTVLQGTTIDVGLLNVTDINSSLGRKIYSYRGVFTNTLNWELLPTDVKPKNSTFVN